ncbi:MAG: SDR family oxidoreductase [Proteobacteria bacterium]|nr:SDR family oxidoreductase [Pseudomonadota bacterium]
MEKFLVTGGAGFIGSNLTETLLEKGHSVRVLDNMATGKEENLKEFFDSIEYIDGDIRDTSTVERAVKGVDYVIHLAALGSVPRSVADPATTHDVNATGTLNILVAAKEANVKRVVCASSSSVYGDTPVLPKEEGMNTTPMSPYAVSKLSAEQYCRVFHMVYGLETVAMRYFNVYGKKQDPHSQYSAVIPKFVAALLAGEAPTIHGDGEQSRDFTFVEDCNQANYKACIAEGAGGSYLNIGAGGRISINELYEKIRAGLGIDIAALHSEPRAGDVKHSLADISKAASTIGYSPNFNIDSGIEATLKWYTDHQE